MQPPRGPDRIGEFRSAVEAIVAGVFQPTITGFADGTIIRTYQRLFDPQFGSIRDLS